MANIPAIDAPAGAYRERGIVPARTALLNIDMQNGEFNAEILARARSAGTPESKKRDFYERIDSVVIPNQARLQDAARKAGIEVIFTVIESLTQDGRDRSLDYKISGLFCPIGSRDAQVVDALAPLPDEIVITKTSSSVFISTNLHYVLGNLGIRYLIIAGGLTDQCVDSAVRDACDLGYLVTVPTDACVTQSKGRHDTSLINNKGYCRQMTTAALLEEIASRPV